MNTADKIIRVRRRVAIFLVLITTFSLGFLAWKFFNKSVGDIRWNIASHPTPARYVSITEPVNATIRGDVRDVEFVDAETSVSIEEITARSTESISLPIDTLVPIPHTPTGTPTFTPIPATPAPSPTHTLTPTSLPDTATATKTPTSPPTSTHTPAPTDTPTPTFTPTPTPTPTDTPVPPTNTPTHTPTHTPVPPASPSNLQATARDTQSIHLTWLDNASNETGFEISTGDEIIGVVGENSTQYTLSGLSADTQYCYRVRAYSSFGVSAWSDWVCDRTHYSYFDDFSDESTSWPVEWGPPSRTIYVDGTYEIGIYDTGVYNKEAWSTNAAYATVGNANYDVQADMSLYYGGSIRYGFVFDVLDANNFYVFSVNPREDTQSWKVELIQSSGRTTIIEGNSSVINTGFATNVVSLSKTGDHVRMFVNGIQVGEFIGGAFSSTSLKVGIIC